MRLSDDGVALIARFEGFRADAYLDVVGVPTIGYGSTKGVRLGQHITQAEALARLKREVASTYGAAIDALVRAGVRLNQNQYDALVSFVYNVGPGGVGTGSTVGRLLRAGRLREAADGLLAWNRAGGKVLEGLTNRRRAERALFLTPVAPSGPAAWLTPVELRRVRELDAIRAGAAPSHPGREDVLVRVLTAQRKAIWRLAQSKDKGGDGRGWDYGHRRQRYKSLLARTA